MSSTKILIIGIFGVLAVMVITAAIHLIAPYVAVMLVIGCAVFGVIKSRPPKE